MRLDVGLAADLETAAPLVQRWLRRRLDSRDDLELGGHYLSYSPKPLPATGLCGVRVRQNHVEGVGWCLPRRPDVATCVEIEVCGPDLLELGRLAARGGAVCGDRLAVDSYVVTRLPIDAEDPVLPRAHLVRFGQDRRPVAACPELQCHVTFGFVNDDFDAARTVAADVLQGAVTENAADDLGGRYFEIAAPSARGLVRRNQISPVQWLYPRHKSHALLLDVAWQTANLLELGELALHVEDRFAGRLSVIGYRVIGDLVRDRVPRLFTYERD
jgi:hypothetical protein